MLFLALLNWIFLKKTVSFKSKRVRVLLTLFISSRCKMLCSYISLIVLASCRSTPQRRIGVEVSLDYGCVLSLPCSGMFVLRKLNVLSFFCLPVC